MVLGVVEVSYERGTPLVCAQLERCVRCKVFHIASVEGLAKPRTLSGQHCALAHQVISVRLESNF